MRENSMNIKKRNNFLDINTEETAYIPYAAYKEFPTRYDYRDGQEKSIVLRNKLTGELEEIEYKYCGAVPLHNNEGYQWYWGDIKSNDLHACLVFYFFPDGTFKEAAATLCGGSLSSEEFKELQKGTRCAAEVTAKFF